MLNLKKYDAGNYFELYSCKKTKTKFKVVYLFLKIRDEFIHTRANFTDIKMEYEKGKLFWYTHLDNMFFVLCTYYFNKFYTCHQEHHQVSFYLFNLKQPFPERLPEEKIHKDATSLEWQKIIKKITKN